MHTATANTSATVKIGMDRVCKDFTVLIAPLGFVRTNARGRAWTRFGSRLRHVVYFHRVGSSYGAPRNNSVSILVNFSFQDEEGLPVRIDPLTSNMVRDERGYAYHLRFNAVTGSTYQRCLDDLIRVTKEHGLPWFAK